MQATTRFHDSVPNPILQESDFVFHDSVTFHATNRVFNPHSDGGNTTIGLLLRRGQFPSRWCFLGLHDRHVLQSESLEAFILIQTAARWQGIACQLRQAFLRRFAFTGVAQEANVTGLLDHEKVFERVALLLATVIVLLLLGIFRTLDWSFSTIMPKRGGADPSFEGVVASSAANSSPVRAGSRSCCAKARFNTVCRR